LPEGSCGVTGDIERYLPGGLHLAHRIVNPYVQ
jgi:hypothetical protein